MGNRVDLDPGIVEELRREWESAPFGTQRNIVQKYADILRCTPKTLYEHIDTGRRRRGGDHRIEGIVESAYILALIKKMAQPEISTDQALKIGIDNKRIPASMAEVHPSTFNRLIRGLGLHKRSRRVQPYHARYANELHHLDASTSEYFYVKRRMRDGQYVLGLHGSPGGYKKVYKNKPMPLGVRCWIYGAVDGYSGRFVAHYCVGVGESLADNLQFVVYAWNRLGLPERVKGDCGPMMRSRAGREMIERLGIRRDPSRPNAKESHGMIERPWRTGWHRFERPFFAQTDWRNFEITEVELNRRFEIFLGDDYNARPSRCDKNLSRFDAWWQSINSRGGRIELPLNAIATAARRVERKVDRAGCFSLDGTVFEVVGGLCDVTVYVYLGIFEDKVVVQDRETGNRYEARPFAPTPLDTFVSHPETPHQKAVKAAQDLELVNTLHLESEDPRNVTRFPIRTKGTCVVEDPFDLSTYRSMDEAIAEFLSICPCAMDAEDRRELEAAILEVGLNRRAVKDLALESFKELERRKAHA